MTPAPLAIVRGLGRSYPFLKMPTRHGATGRWVFLVFRHGEPDPAWVVKGTRDVRGVPALRAERDALRRLSTHVSDTPLSAQVPRLLGWDESDTEACLVETFLAGDPLSGRLAPASAIGAGLEWLVEFHGLRCRPRTALRDDDLEAACDAVRALLPDELRGPALREIASLEGREVPRGLVHGDFNPHNVHRDGGTLSVVDWEDAQDEGIVSDDVYDYAAVAEFIGRPAPCDAITAALGALGVPRELERPLRLHAAARSLAREAAREPFDAGGEGRERWVRLVRRELEANDGRLVGG